jgi:DNA-binding CsgD family transcriptional regulator
VIELRSRRATVVVDPSDCIWDGAADDFARLGEQNPMLAHVARTHDRRALLLSDFVTRRALHRTELYAHVYSRIPMEYQLAMSLGSPSQADAGASEVVGLSLGRIRRDFGRADACLLEALRPHFTSTLERLHELALSRAIISADPQAASRWLLLIDNESTVAWANPAAAGGLDLTIGGPLPRPLRHWVEAERGGLGSAEGVPVTVSDLQVRPRLVRDAYLELDALHLTPLTDRPSPEALRSLGLTPRQVDVLELALQGATAGAIADALGLSRRTVEKHFEGIYARLGADNRAEAVVTVMQAMK